MKLFTKFRDGRIFGLGSTSNTYVNIKIKIILINSQLIFFVFKYGVINIGAIQQNWNDNIRNNILLVSKFIEWIEVGANFSLHLN